MRKKILWALLMLLTSLGGMTAQSKMLPTGERLGRGVAALRAADGSVYVTWRTLETDKRGEPFNIYRNGRKLNKQPMTTGGTFFIDRQPIGGDAVYEVRGGNSNGSCTLKEDSPTGYIPIKLNRPQGGITPDGKTYEYWANDASIGDADGDGEYEIFLKWEPSNYHDNAHNGYTGPVMIDCYSIVNGNLLWRIDLGCNIRAGAHYTQFMVYDFDGDGRCELICKTADGSKDGTGRIIGDSAKDWRNHQPTHINPSKREQSLVGRILEGPEFLTVFDGNTGKALYTTDYLPQRGDITSWGDNYGNRCDRFLAGVAFLDGKRPSAIFCRGYYTRTVIVAWDWDGHKLSQRWTFDTNEPQWKEYAGQGNHNLRICDVDGDDCDEILYGSMAVNNNGRGLYNTGLGHGDAMHLVPQPKGGRLLVWDCHENKRDGVELRDAGTGHVVFQNKSPIDVGRCLAADFDSSSPGCELWSIADRHIYNTKGDIVHDSICSGLSCNFAIWWDGDLLRELLDHETVAKYDAASNRFLPIMHFDNCLFNNWTKSTPCLQADILGDWREEVITRTADNQELRIYVSPHPTKYRISCLELDRAYRLSVATENVGYNQPPEAAYYIGPDDTSYLK